MKRDEFWLLSLFFSNVFALIIILDNRWSLLMRGISDCIKNVPTEDDTLTFSDINKSSSDWKFFWNKFKTKHFQYTYTDEWK